MKNKIANVCNCIFSWGMVLAMFAAFALFLSFVVAFFVGEDTAALITTFMYKTVLQKMYILSVVVSLIGLIGMYLRGEKAMMMTGKKKAK